MKVLFAVNNENISESILKKYQKDYKEIISYKNVYYFNAILKELQKDKSYDRIVISEDLEPFANNNYDIIDKFLFEKLDKISDEATDASGNDIPIILICTDRRAKSDGMLVKLFGIGIYSAIIGQDRSIDEVCRLIYMPRTKKEAKQYYRIEIEDVTYQTENESDVSEVEIQNILAHYKRLGKNTERYVDSFNNIAAQYTDSQLRVIAKFLPLNVKVVLEAESPKYQEVVMANTNTSKKQAVKYGTATKNETKNKKSGKEEIKLDAFETRTQPTNLDNPVVIPSAVSGIKPRKLVTNVSPISTTETKKEVQPIVPIEPIKKGRGRPKKVQAEELNEIEEMEPKRGRGRPKKVIEEKNYLEEKERPPVNLFDLEEESIEQEEPVNLFNLREEKQEEQEPVNLFELQEEIVDIPEKPTYHPEKIRQENPNSYQTNDNAYSSYHNQTAFRDRNETLGEGKLVAFVGTGKNGTSFLVNNLALLLSSMGVNTAILDLTANKNSYYIFTKNEEELRKIATHSITELAKGNAKGITVNRNLTVYTGLPGEEISDIPAGNILQTIANQHNVILIDCDFATPMEYFKIANEIYLVQSMDILTIQPFTLFLRDLKTNGILQPEKLRIVINKYQKMRNLNEKMLLGGLSSYNDPAMSFMTELFNKDTIKYVVIPFDTAVYRNYLEGLVICDISIKEYTKPFIEGLRELGNLIYPITTKVNYAKPSPKKTNYEQPRFSSSMNDTLKQMKNKY